MSTPIGTRVRPTFEVAWNIPLEWKVDTGMRIGELADRFGINPKTIRFYESVGLLPEPDRTSSGYRQYSGIDVDRLTFIKTAQRLGMTLDEIREILAFRDRGQPPCGYVRAVLNQQVAELDQRIVESARLREELVALRSQRRPHF